MAFIIHTCIRECHRTSFECVVDGDGTPAVTMVHDDAVDGFGQAARVAPRQGCKNGEGIEKVRAFQPVNCIYIIHQTYYEF